MDDRCFSTEQLVGRGDVRSTIYDKENDPAKGKAEYMHSRKAAILTWPLRSIYTDTTWYGDIIIDKTISVMPGIHLAIMHIPGPCFHRDPVFM